MAPQRWPRSDGNEVSIEMVEVVRSNDPVYLSWAEAMLRAEGIASLMLDLHISAVEGNIGAFPRRLLVADDSLKRARQVLRDAAAAESPLDA